MPRPTPAQLAYGSVTVIFSALAMLLLSQTRSGPGIAVIAIVATAVGVLVALTAPGLRLVRRSPARRGPARQRARTARTANSAPTAASSATAASAAAPQRIPGATASRANSGSRMAEPSL